METDHFCSNSSPAGFLIKILRWLACFKQDLSCRLSFLTFLCFSTRSEMQIPWIREGNIRFSRRVLVFVFLFIRHSIITNRFWYSLYCQACDLEVREGSYWDEQTNVHLSSRLSVKGVSLSIFPSASLRVLDVLTSLKTWLLQLPRLFALFSRFSKDGLTPEQMIFAAATRQR